VLESRQRSDCFFGRFDAARDCLPMRFQCRPELRSGVPAGTGITPGQFRRTSLPGGR